MSQFVYRTLLILVVIAVSVVLIVLSISSWNANMQRNRELEQAGPEIAERNRISIDVQRDQNVITARIRDRPEDLVNQLLDADPSQFGALLLQFKNQGNNGLQVLNQVLSEDASRNEAYSDKDKLAKRQANAAIVKLRMGDPPTLWTHFRASLDPRLRSYLIHDLAPLGVSGDLVIQRFMEEHEPIVRQALILSLGEYGEKELPPQKRASLLPMLREVHQKDANPGLHAAAEWLLRQWSQGDWLQAERDKWIAAKPAREERLESIKKSMQRPGEKAAPQWYVNGQGQMMVVIPGPVEFQMGSPSWEVSRRDDETQHQRRIDRSFALAATPVTKEQFLKFMPEFAQNDLKRSPHPGCPIGGVLWSEAAAYCNWLSKEEGIPRQQWCYEIERDEARPKETYLKLLGYRLPTEAEMEYAARAGTVTSRYFGESDELLLKYAWYEKNSQDRTWPVGSLKPNDLGFFDILGNIYVWCHENYYAYPAPKEDGVVADREAGVAPDITARNVLRGGSFYNQSSTLRCATRFSALSNYRNDFYGLRAARTVAP